MVEPRFDWGATRVTPAQFRRQLYRALEIGCEFMTLSDYVAGEAQRPMQVALTFDDGYESVHKYAFPILREHGIVATVFIIPGFIGQYNTWDVNIGWLRFPHLDWHQINDLVDAGWEIGSHGMFHRDLTRISSEEAEEEISLSRLLIERRTGAFNGIIAYPFGNVNHQVWKTVSQFGYAGGVVMGRTDTDIPGHFAIRRTGIYLFDTLNSFQQKVVAKNRWFYHIMQRIMDTCSDGAVIVKKRSW
jgi:peptidoglycan/xylan/chitin deacetylase (PgdA/CDA1 family)